MIKLGILVSLILILSGCATSGYRTAGVEPSFAWQVQDLRFDQPTERHSSGSYVQRATFGFNLEMQERQGKTIRFDHLVYTVAGAGGSRSKPVEQYGSWVLSPYEKTYIRGIAINYRRNCRGGSCPQFTAAPYWFFDLSGVDENGTPVKYVWDVTLPMDSQSRPSLGTRNLKDADLTYALLTDADLVGANLGGANLTGAKLNGADLSRAELHRANLTGTNLRHVLHLTQEQLDRACVDGTTQLPDGIKRPDPC